MSPWRTQPRLWTCSWSRTWCSNVPPSSWTHSRTTVPARDPYRPGYWRWTLWRHPRYSPLPFLLSVRPLPLCTVYIFSTSPLSPIKPTGTVCELVLLKATWHSVYYARVIPREVSRPSGSDHLRFLWNLADLIVLERKPFDQNFSPLWSLVGKIEGPKVRPFGLFWEK
jgi:hypothetical protein